MLLIRVKANDLVIQNRKLFERLTEELPSLSKGVRAICFEKTQKSLKWKTLEMFTLRVLTLKGESFCQGTLIISQY